MQYATSPRPIPGAVATLGVDERVAFIRKTYAHLGGAILAFVLLCYLMVTSGFARDLSLWALSGGGYNWLLFLGLFMGGSWVATRWAQSDTSRSIQYLGLALYVVLEALIFTPILYIAAYYTDPSVIPTAGVLTLLIFAGLTGTVFLTKKDFSFLRGALNIGVMAAFGLIIAGILFGFNLGLFFSFAMVILMSGYILYYTSQVFAHYRPTQYVAASLALFSAIATLFFYVLQIVMSLND